MIIAPGSNISSIAPTARPTFRSNNTHEHLTDTGGPTATIVTEVDIPTDIFEQPTENAAPIDGDHGFEGDLLGADDETSVGTPITTSVAPITTSGTLVTM